VRHTKIGLLILTTAFAGPLAGCVVAPPPPRPIVEQPGVAYVQTPPPAPLAEAVPPPPGPDSAFVWKPGHWRWNGREYVWHAGLWERRERAGEWVPAHWENGPQGWFFVEGRWR
jgi:hypothetical protein